MVTPPRPEAISLIRLRLLRTNIHHFPDMAIQILKTVVAHSAAILPLIVGLAASGDRLTPHVIPLRPAALRQASNASMAFLALPIGLEVNIFYLAWVNNIS